MVSDKIIYCRLPYVSEKILTLDLENEREGRNLQQKLLEEPLDIQKKHYFY